MGRIDRDELLRRVDLAELLTRLAPAAERPVHRRWRCIHPNHEDRHPSVSIRVVDGIGRWRCWSCGRGGTAIDALVAAQGLAVGEAIDQLAARALPAPIEHDADDKPVPLHPSVARYADACHRVLFTNTGRPIFDWLTLERELSPEVLEANRVGADPGPSLLGRRRGLPRDGVAAVLPVYDSTGALAYVQARYLHPDSRRKYGNPVARLGSNPGLAWLHTPVQYFPEVLLVCEGIIDGLTAATAGVPAVAVLGATYPSVAIADTITVHAGGREVVVAFDGDDAGRTAATRLWHMLRDRDVNASVLPMDDGEDLNDLALFYSEWAVDLLEPVETKS